MTMFPITLSTVHAQSVDSNTAGRPTASLATLMPEPQNVDVGLVVAQMTIESSFRSRELARADKNHAQQAMKAAQDAQLEAMRKQADENHSAGQLEAFGKLFEGGLGLGGGALSTGVLGSSWAAYGQLGAPGGKVGACAFGLLAVGHKEGGDRAGVAAKAAEMEAGAQKHALDNAEDELKEARAHAQKALDFLRELRSTEARSMAAAIRG